MARLFGKKGQSINYRHIIDSLVRKPGAFENYQYREEMFPTTQFRIAYDMLRESHSAKVADKNYLKILELAARQSQDAVNDALRLMITSNEPIDSEKIRLLVDDATRLPAVTDVEIEPPNLDELDSLLQHPDMEGTCDDREPEPSELSVGADDARMRSPKTGPNQPSDDTIEPTLGQDMEVVRLGASSLERETANGNLEGRIVPEPPRERVDFLRTGVQLGL